MTTAKHETSASAKNMQATVLQTSGNFSTLTYILDLVGPYLA